MLDFQCQCLRKKPIWDCFNLNILHTTDTNSDPELWFLSFTVGPPQHYKAITWLSVLGRKKKLHFVVSCTNKQWMHTLCEDALRAKTGIRANPVLWVKAGSKAEGGNSQIQTDSILNLLFIQGVKGVTILPFYLLNSRLVWVCITDPRSSNELHYRCEDSDFPVLVQPASHSITLRLDADNSFFRELKGYIGGLVAGALSYHFSMLCVAARCKNPPPSQNPTSPKGIRPGQGSGEGSCTGKALTQLLLQPGHGGMTGSGGMLDQFRQRAAKAGKKLVKDRAMDRGNKGSLLRTPKEEGWW